MIKSNGPSIEPCGIPLIALDQLENWSLLISCFYLLQESPAIADKPARRESLPKIAPIRRAYNVVADNTGLSSCV